jgi:hypothetical protein
MRIPFSALSLIRPTVHSVKVLDFASAVDWLDCECEENGNG